MISELHVAPDHAAFAGHFPGFPILPGAALLDAALHAIGHGRGLDLAHWRIANVKFQGRVLPGDLITLEHEMNDGRTLRFTARSVRGAVASGMLTRGA